uniref:GLI pathogenesis-related 2 n=1 Tax=Oreochromis niloticus TaxID=8128 RepID=A0A669EIS2_ORENI
MPSINFKKEFLDTHNAYRAQHGAPPLTFNTELNDAAQNWANQMLAKKKLGHSDTNDGENVYYAWSSETKTLTGKEAVDSWYSEIKDYDFKKSGHQPKTGHFTQVVWKSSTELGVGIATDGNTVFVVGQYRPAGNITNAGYYQKNVLPKGTGNTHTHFPITEYIPQNVVCNVFYLKLVCFADESFKKEFLDTHNAYRAQHGAPPLTFNTELNDAAQNWANQMLAKKKLGHSDTNDGENVYYAWSSETKTLTGKEAVDSWYSEIKDYDFKKSGHQPKTGHFTQVVWKSSTELGVGIATDGNTVFVVGQYRPAGNITNAGYYQKNVLPKGTGNTHTHFPVLLKMLFLRIYKVLNLYFHGAPPLTFNTELNDAAQNWANQMLAKKKLGHSDTNDGENVYYAWSSETKTLTGKEAVDSWYSEIKDYDFKKSGHQPKTGHFTQVVWKSSTELGVGIATDGNTVFVVGQYRPAGNITNAGYYQKNVLPKGTGNTHTHFPVLLLLLQR